LNLRIRFSCSPSTRRSFFDSVATHVSNSETPVEPSSVTNVCRSSGLAANEKPMLKSEDGRAR
jgi:hypothetical protein